MIRTRHMERLLSFILIISIVLSTMGCSKSQSNQTNPGLSDPTPQIVVENIETEEIETETILGEHITKEIYLKEFVWAEEKINELLLEEETITEVLLCKTIYVSEDSIEEFAENSQISMLFGSEVDIKTFLKKVAIGTGVIVTIAIVKKANVPNSIASIVATAADETVRFSSSGAVVGTMFGAFNGAVKEIDDTGRASAALGFALATVGMIVTAVSFVGAVPSGGTTGFGVAEGVHLAWAGVRLLLATSGTIYSARESIKVFTETDASEIDWGNVDWDKVGVTAAQKAIQNGADGYMWGAVYGAIDGTVEGYYQKFCTPYTKYQDRLKHVPKNNDKGHWSGKRGESDYILNKPIELSDGTKITKVSYQNAVPDFSEYAIAEVKISKMTDDRIKKGGNYDQADEALAKYWSEIKYNGRSTWTKDEVKIFRENYPYKLTWHEMSNMESMQLVPYEVNDTFSHYGGVAEYNVMIGQSGGADFD